MHHPLRILLVEDNAGDARLIREDLKEPNVPHEVYLVTRMDEALDRLRLDKDASIDVVLLDLTLPDARGLEAVEKIRAEVPRLPIVVLTGLDDETVAFQAVEEGVQDYLVKGRVNGSVLVRALRYAIERKRADEARRREEEAEREARFRETIMAILGHDLRTPVQSISVSAQMLLRSNLEPKCADAAARIVRSSDRVAKLIDALLDFTRARLGGGYQLSETECDLREICEQVVDEIAVSHPRRAISLGGDATIKGRWDRGRLARVVSNLLGNAVSYGAAGTPVEVTARAAGTDAVLTVHNDGDPIAPEMLERLFEPFRRGAGAEGRSDGLGLGLYIVQQIVAAHRGTISVQSTAAQGTTFTVELPRG